MIDLDRQIWADLREYLSTLREMLDQEAGKGWPVLHAITSLDTVLREQWPDFDRETNYLRDRLAEHEHARLQTDASGFPLPTSVPPEEIRDAYQHRAGEEG